MNLIKKYDPKYNILLRDDKRYAYIELTNETVPRLTIVRNVNRKRKNQTRIFGPYPNVTAARNTVNLLNRIYPLRKCRTYQKKPCLYYHIGQCLGYCTNQVPSKQIKELEEEILKFLRGDASFVLNKIETDMYEASNNLNFERAKELKELRDYIQITLQKQKVEINDTTSRDVFGYFVDKGYLSIQVFFIRGGKILERHSAIFPLIDEVENEVIRYIATFYEKDILPPKEIMIPNLSGAEELSSYLEVPVHIPLRGVKRKLVDMACKNAEIALNEKFELIQKDEKKTIGANDELRDILHLDKLDRIELFDNSNLCRFILSWLGNEKNKKFEVMQNEKFTFLFCFRL